MHKVWLQNIFDQNQMTCSFALGKITPENAGFRLNRQAASVGFIYRHIAELINLFPGFFGLTTGVQNSTMGQTDTGQGRDIEESKALYESGLKVWQNIIDTTPEEEWLQIVDTPFFGPVTKLRLFSHVLFHNSHHCGQIALTLSKGSNLPHTT